MTQNPVATAQKIKTAFTEAQAAIKQADETHKQAYQKIQKEFPQNLEASIRAAEADKLETVLLDELEGA